MVSKTQTEEYLRKTQLPLATKSYTVISHGDIIDTVRTMLTKHGFIITNELYKAESNGDVALGFMQIETLNDPDMAMTFNWTNSYNKMVRFSCSIGGFIYNNQVPFVSTNNQASWNRKHTGTALEETMEVIEAMVASADDHFAQIVDMKNKFKSIDVNRKEYAKLLGLLYFDKQVISSEQINVIKREYEKPSFTYTDKGTLWELYKMIMFGIVDQAPKNWYRQQMDINSYVQVLYNIASIELENENEAGEMEVSVVNDESIEILDLLIASEDEVLPESETKFEWEAPEVSDNQAVQEEVEIIPVVHQEDIIEFITDEEEDAVMDSMFTPIPAHHEPLIPTQEELDAEHVGPPEMYLGDAPVNEIQSIDNLIAAQNMVLDAKSIGTGEPSLFDDIDAKKERLEEIRTELDNESISYGELVELEELVEYIEEGDVQLLQAAGVPEFEDNIQEMELPDMIVETKEMTRSEVIEEYGDILTEEQISIIKEEHGIIETGSPDDGLIGSTDESPESLFDLMDEYDESQGEEVPWFTDENATDKVDLAPSLIPDSMREAVSEILADKYQNKRSVVNTIEDTDYMVFELDSKEFFVVDK